MNHELKILIAETCENFREILRFMLEDKGFKRLFIARSFDEATALFSEKTPDICLIGMDLEKGLKAGIKLAEYIRESSPSIPIVFLSDHHTEDFYRQTRHVPLSAFIGKDISAFTLFHTIDTAVMAAAKAQTNAKTPTPPPPFTQYDKIFFKVGDVYKSIPLTEVAYFFSDQKLSFARVGRRNFPTSAQLKSVEQTLQPHFLRTHKSYLVNISLIEELNLSEGSLQINGEILPVGQAYRRAFVDHVCLLK